MQVYKVKRNQNIFDVAVSIHGSIEGIFDLLINNPNLSFHSQLEEGEEIYWDEEFIIYDSIVNTLQSEHIIPANGERHVYYKSTTASLRCIVYISPEEASIALQMAGDGNLIVDWGDYVMRFPPDAIGVDFGSFGVVDGDYRIGREFDHLFVFGGFGDFERIVGIFKN